MKTNQFDVYERNIMAQLELIYQLELDKGYTAQSIKENIYKLLPDSLSSFPDVVMRRFFNLVLFTSIYMRQEYHNWINSVMQFMLGSCGRQVYGKMILKLPIDALRQLHKKIKHINALSKEEAFALSSHFGVGPGPNGKGVINKSNPPSLNDLNPYFLGVDFSFLMRRNNGPIAYQFFEEEDGYGTFSFYIVVDLS